MPSGPLSVLILARLPGPPGFLKLAAGWSLYQSLQSQQQNGLLHVAFVSPFDHFFQRKLLSELLFIPWCLIKLKLDL